jgi:hypothetical protein
MLMMLLMRLHAGANAAFVIAVLSLVLHALVVRDVSRIGHLKSPVD